MVGPPIVITTEKIIRERYKETTIRNKTQHNTTHPQRDRDLPALH